MINPRQRGREPGASKRERRIVLNRFAIQALGQLEILVEPVRVRFVTACLEIENIGIRIFRRLGFDEAFLFRAQRRAQLGCDLRRQLALQA